MSPTQQCSAEFIRTAVDLAVLAGMEAEARLLRENTPEEEADEAGFDAALRHAQEQELPELKVSWERLKNRVASAWRDRADFAETA